MAADRREDLQRWIADTRRNQRTLGIGVAIGAAVGFALLFWRTSIGGVALGITAIVALSGFWITSSHLLDWQTKLRELDRPVRRTPGRRYQD